jgi:hypothetical protein
MIRLGLWVLHPSYVMRRVERAVESRLSDAKRRQPARIGEIGWAVRAASRRIPGASCLVQALAARLLLADYGKTSELRIGVARGEEGQIDAHAWLEVAGIPVVGGSGIGRFTVFRDLDGALPVAPGRFKNV